MTHEKSHLPNWTGLLSWSTRFSDGTSASQLGPMNPERRAWLETALNSAFKGQQDPNEVMKKAVLEIQAGNFSTGLDLLDHVSDFPDCAINVEVLGALRELVSLITANDAAVVIRALEILGLYLPNNPKIQLSAALKHDCMKSLKASIQQHATNPIVIHGCVSIIGALVRNVAPLERSFIREDGINFLIGICLTYTDAVISRRVCSILASLGQRNDLKAFGTQIDKLLAHIYGNGELPLDNIQLWESVASLVVVTDINDTTLALVKRRIAWIKSLQGNGSNDYEAEIETLQHI